MFNQLFTSESVGPGHPDKICDQIADLVLDECLKKDSESRVACEVMASNKLIIIAGEITTNTYVDVVQIAWKILKRLGYKENDFTIISNVNDQSKDIKRGVNIGGGRIGAGDQGIMFGYATNETPEFMPLPIIIAHSLMKRSETLRLNGEFNWSKSDMKSQVTIDYSAEKPKIHSVVISVQHEKNYIKKTFDNFIKNNIIKYVVEKYNLNFDFKIFINPTGKFVIGGPTGDTGLTGRKIIVDTYGGMSRHGGGSCSGKDYTKVDRSATYVARWMAKNIVAAGLASRIEIQLSYAIGISRPISIALDTFGTGKIENKIILKAIKKTFDLSLIGIIKALKLKKPIYSKTSIFGHFGRDEENFEWEKLNKVDQLQKYIKYIKANKK